MRVVPFLVSAWLCSACDSVFDLEHIDEIDCVKVGHDEDRDGVDDACDPCPFDFDNTTDDDRDGITGACDPDPIGHNTVVLFAGFGPGGTGFTITDGSIVDDTFELTGDGAGTLVWGTDLDNYYVTTAVSVTKLSPNATGHEVGLVFDATQSGTTQANGTICVLGRNGTSDYRQVYARNRPGADANINNSPGAPFSLLELRQIRAFYSRTTMPQASCTFINGPTETTISGTGMTLPTPGGVGVLIDNTDAAFQYLFVASKDS